MSYEIRDSRRGIEQSFLQSPKWERFQQSLGSEVFRAVESLFVVHTLPIVGKYAYCPRGPVMQLRINNEELKIGKTVGAKNFSPKETREEMQEILQEMKKRECWWIRIEPISKEELQGIQKSISNLVVTGYRSLITCQRAPRDVQPREILVMDISKPEEELLAEMKSKTRYNIRLAEKKGVRVIVSKEKKYQERFIELVRETAKRVGIRPHIEEHYLKMFEALGESVDLYNAEYNGKVIASNMMIFLEEGAIYLHGGSSNEYRNVMASFLLQWRAILDAKKRGCGWYDFGGVSTKPKMENGEQKTEKKEWGGITTFKQGFCPEIAPTQFPGTWDIVLSPWRYRMYQMLQKMRC